MKKLTQEGARKLNSLRGRAREVPDAGAAGLRLAIQPSGKRSWIMRFRRPSGRQGKLTLGNFTTVELEGAPVLGQPMTLKAARVAAAEVNRQRALGVDVIARHVEQQRRRAAEAAAPATFAAVARRFADEHAMRNRSGRVGTVRLLGLDYPRDGGEPAVTAGGLVDRWRDRPIAEIDSGDVYGVISELVKVGIPGIKTRRDKKGARDSRGRALAAALSKLFSWAVAHRLAVANPTQGVFRPRAAAPRHRVLADAEVKKLWRACDEVGPPFGTIVKLLLLTGQRRSEVAGVRWSELSEDLATWSLPPERTKNKLPHQVHLPELAREIVAAVPRMSSHDFVFSTTGETAVSGWSRAKKTIDAATGPLPEWRVHDLRRTAASGMQKLGVRLEVVERALNHVSGSFGGVAGIYQRDPMTEETQSALELWSQHVAAIAAGRSADVVPMRRGQ